MELKLGKLPVRIDNRTIKLSSVFKKELLPPLPDKYNIDNTLEGLIDNRVFANDIWGNCVIAGRAHQTLRFEAFEQRICSYPITDDEVVNEYLKETNGLDTGLIMLNSINLWRKEGWIAADKEHNIYAFASVSFRNTNEVKYCIYLLYGAYAGILLPESAKSQFENGELWHVVLGPDSYPGSWGGHCFTGDTKIPLLNGTEITLKDLAENYNNKEFWVYSLDENQNIVAGKGCKPKLTGKKVKILKITLDNGETIKCTGNHLFLMRDNTYKEAKLLQINDSLMPLYRKLGRGGYEECLIPNKDKYAFTHEIIAKQFLGDKPKIKIKKNSDRIITHHINFNKKDNSPKNFKYMTFIEHTDLHKDSISILNKTSESRDRSRKAMNKLWNNPEWRKNRIRQNGINGKNRMLKMIKQSIPIGFQSMDKDKLREMARKNGNKNIHFAHTPEAIKKSSQTRIKRCKEDPIFREIVKNSAIKRGKIQHDNCIKRKKEKKIAVAIQNITPYNNEIKSGLRKLTSSQLRGLKIGRQKQIKNIREKAKMGIPIGFQLMDKAKLSQLGYINGKKNFGKIRSPEAIKKAKETFNKHLEDKDFYIRIRDTACKNLSKTTNHKVLYIEDAGFEDVYDFTVEKYHNFALSSGVFVHNCVYLSSYNSIGPICMTWGKKQQMTWEFWNIYCDECYGIVDNINKWMNPTTDPLDVQKLNQYLNEITESPINPAPTPSPCVMGKYISKILNIFPNIFSRKGRFYYMDLPKQDYNKHGKHQ